MSQERTESATPKKRRDARRKGQVARSSELSGALSLLAAFLVLSASGPWAWQHLWWNMTGFFAAAGTRELSPALVGNMMLQAAETSVLLAAPVAGAAVLAGVGTGLLQTGLVSAPNLLAPDFSRIDPLSGAKKVFSRRALVEMVKAVAKVAVVGYFAFQGVRGDMNRLIALGDMKLAPAAGMALSIASGMMVRAASSLAVIGALDYLYQFYEFEMGLRMTKQELREESKETEGRPEVRQKIKERQRQMSRRRMMAQVPKADVIVTNPTHFAVALQYDPKLASAPVCLAKGADLVAARIRRIAKLHQIPIVENPPLAQALYRTVEVGRTIPSDLYRAVAEVLAFVYRLKGRVPA